jgi:CheY-like chemotaxis protein
MHVDRVAIGQVLTNLVVNALQAAPGGTVRVHAAADGETLRVVVEDEGDGIPLDVLPRVFEPFFTTKPVGLGTGLGLSVSLGIAEHHGGTLRAENRHDGGGARMTLTLPLVAAPAPLEVIPDAPTEVTLGDRAGRRVLVVDDEPAIRRALARYFARRGWQVDEAGNGQDALERLLAPDPADRTEYDLVVSDLRMPGVSGADLHDRLAIERSDLLDRLVFSTGDLVSHDAAAFVARTQCAVLEKPFQFATLDALIERITARAAAT